MHVQKGASKIDELTSTLKNVTIVLYGTKEVPVHAKSPKQYQNVTKFPESNETYLNNEESINIGDIEVTFLVAIQLKFKFQNTVRDARRAISEQTPETEQHLLAVDRLVRRINKMNLRAKRSRNFTHIHHVYEKQLSVYQLKTPRLCTMFLFICTSIDVALMFGSLMEILH